MKSRIIALLAFACLLMFNIKPGAAQNKETPCAAPAIATAKLMNALEISNKGYLRIGELYATCLPEPVTKSSSVYPYDPDEGGKFSTVVKSADGKTLATFVWYVEKVSTLWVMNHYKVVGGPSSVKPLEPGNYLLEFAIEDKPFYRFPFSVSKMDNGDIYDPGDIYYLDGFWNDYAALFYLKPDRYTQLHVWLREKGKPSRKETQYEMQLIRLSDGKVIAEAGGEDSAMKLQPSWINFKLSFRPLKDQIAQKGYEFKASELLNADGAYKIRLTVDGKLYGEYPFLVKGGKLQNQNRKSVEFSDPLVHFEDGENFLWIKKDK